MNDIVLPVILSEVTEAWDDEEIQAPIRVVMPLGAIWGMGGMVILPLIAIWAAFS